MSAAGTDRSASATDLRPIHQLRISSPASCPTTPDISREGGTRSSSTAQLLAIHLEEFAPHLVELVDRGLIDHRSVVLHAAEPLSCSVEHDRRKLSLPT